MTITGAVFLLAFFGGLALALFRDPIVGLYLYVAEFYLSPPSRWWGESLPDLRWSLLAAGVTLFALLLRAPGSQTKSWLSSPAAKIMVIFTMWFWIESLWAIDTQTHHRFAIQVTKYLVVFYLIYRLVDTPQRVTAFLLMHVAGCLYIGLLAYGAGASSNTNDGRLDGVGGPGVGDANTLGMQMATAVAVAAMLALHLKTWRFALCVVSIAFCLNAMVLAGSRGAFLSLLVSGIALAYLKPPAYRKRFYAFAMLGVVAIGYVATDRFWDRMATTQAVVEGRASEMDTSAYSRIAIIEAQIQMAKAYPFGTGHRGTAVLSKQYIDEKYMSEDGSRASHNVFMTLLVEEGIPGAISFFAMIWWAATTLKRLARTPRAGAEQLTRAVQAAAIGGALTVVLVAGVFADFSQAEVQVWMLAALAALARIPIKDDGSSARLATPHTMGSAALSG